MKGARSRAAVASKAKVCLNLLLPEELLIGLRRWAKELGITPPELARRLLRQGLEELEREELDRRLVRGYQELAEENRQLLKEFSTVDLEGWEPEAETEEAS